MIGCRRGAEPFQGGAEGVLNHLPKPLLKGAEDLPKGCVLNPPYPLWPSAGASALGSQASAEGLAARRGVSDGTEVALADCRPLAEITAGYGSNGQPVPLLQRRRTADMRRRMWLKRCGRAR
jgi:hypothetical protein